jgi:hypothetical protein
MVVMIAAALQGGLVISYFVVIRMDGNMKREKAGSI